MKNLLTLTLLIALFVGCKDDGISPKSQDLQLLTNSPWSHAVVRHAMDGDLSDQYENFAISFSNHAEDGFDGTFIISNGGYAFPENTGKWKFSDDLDQIIFDNGRDIVYDIDGQTLKLDFTISHPGGRTNGLSGHFIFDLKPL